MTTVILTNQTRSQLSPHLTSPCPTQHPTTSTHIMGTMTTARKPRIQSCGCFEIPKKVIPKCILTNPSRLNQRTRRRVPFRVNHRPNFQLLQIPFRNEKEMRYPRNPKQPTTRIRILISFIFQCCPSPHQTHRSHSHSRRNCNQWYLSNRRQQHPHRHLPWHQGPS